MTNSQIHSIASSFAARRRLPTAGCFLAAASPLRLRRAGGVGAILIRVFSRRASPQPFAQVALAIAAARGRR